MVENVFVVGLNDHSAAILNRLPDADRYRFHRLLSSDELLFRDTIPLPDLLAEAQQQIEAFDGPVHAIIGFWDFPVSTMVPMLCERLGASLGQPGVGGEMRAQVLEQARATTRDRRVPAVRAGGPRRRADPARRLALPGVGQAGQVGLVRPRLPGGGRQQLRQAVAAIREGIGADGRPVRLRAVPAPAPARGERRRRARLPGRGGGDRGAGHRRGLQLPGRRPRLRHRRLDHLRRTARASCATSTPPRSLPP